MIIFSISTLIFTLSIKKTRNNDRRQKVYNNNVMYYVFMLLNEFRLCVCVSMSLSLSFSHSDNFLFVTRAHLRPLPATALGLKRVYVYNTRVLADDSGGGESIVIFVIGAPGRIVAKNATPRQRTHRDRAVAPGWRLKKYTTRNLDTTAAAIML